MPLCPVPVAGSPSSILSLHRFAGTMSTDVARPGPRIEAKLCLFLANLSYGASVPEPRKIDRGKIEVAEADLDVVIRSLAKKQVKALTDAASRHLARNTLSLAAAAARRLRITAENTAYSYARSIKKAAEEYPAAKSGEKVAKTKKG